MRSSHPLLPLRATARRVDMEGLDEQQWTTTNYGGQTVGKCQCAYILALRRRTRYFRVHGPTFIVTIM